MTELTTYIGRYVYTPRGHYVGTVSNVIIDLPTRRVASLLLTRTNATLIDDSRDVAVPYRWVGAVGDIVVLSTFPEHVDAPAEVPAEEQPIAA